MREMSNAAAERRAAQNALQRGELKERDTYTAKQIAMRCGTDAKTMRKFFRSTFSSTEAVGQGGRYEFDAKDMPKIKKEFQQWLTRKTIKRPKAASEMNLSTPRRRRSEVSGLVAAVDKAISELEVEELINDPDVEDSEPTAEELAELETMMEEGGI